MGATPVANSKICRHLMEPEYPSLLSSSSSSKHGFEMVRLRNRGGSWGLRTNHGDRLSLLTPIKAAEDKGIACTDDREGNTVGNSTNITWHDCPFNKLARQELLQQKGCVIWITGLSGSDTKSCFGEARVLSDFVAAYPKFGLASIIGKSTLACALSRGLHSRGKLTYILDGDNVRHGLNSDLSFTAKDREENIRRIGEVAKLFTDAGIICVACLISPYRKDRAMCCALLPKVGFIEVFMDVSLQICEARDPKGLYKLARAGKIKGFTGIDDPYEPPLDCKIVLQQKGLDCSCPHDLAEKVILYLEERGYLEA